jgi:hypothetical protein
VQLSPDDALALRMASLLLRTGPVRPHAGPADMADVAGVVTWFGAMQAQDLNSTVWSLGVRLPGCTADDIAAALERREALRTWPMRGTVHLVPARDAGWMLELMGARALAGAAARRASLGLDETTADRAVRVLADVLAGGGRRTRAQCLAALAEAGIPSTGPLGYHLLWYASQRGVICIAPNVGKEQTFVRLDEWVPDPRRPDRDEALATIVVRYFRSHGPCTRQDFVRWTGLTATDAKRGIAAAGEQLAAVRVDGREMWLDRSLLDGYRAAGAGWPTGEDGDGMLALPGFDEYLLGFADRSLMLADEHKDAIVPGGNGVFQPTIVRAGRVVGTWKRTARRNRVIVDVRPLVRLRAADRARVEDALQPYGRFVGQPVEIHWP